MEAVHALTTANVWAQQGVEVDGQTDILTMGLPYICPYNVNSIMNPILVACLGLGYFFNMYRGKPLVREGGVVIMKHPTRPEFHPGHHPSYIDFYEQVLTQTVDPVQMHKEFEESFATDPWYVHLYRTGHAYHGVHPFYMWYWCAHALAHLGPRHRRRRGPQGGTPARLLAGELAQRRPGDRVRRRRALADPDAHAQPTDLHVGRPLMAGSGLRGRVRSARFPFAAPSWPTTVERPDPERKVGLDYDHEWSRRYPVRLARAMVMDNLARPAARLLAPATVRGLEHLQHVEGPVIFAVQPPQPHRHAVAADHPARRVPPPHRRGGGVGLLLRPHLEGGAVVVRPGHHPDRAAARSTASRATPQPSSSRTAGTWSSSPKAGARPTAGPSPSPAGAAYLARRTGRPVVPVYLHGTRHVQPKSAEAEGRAPGGSGTESRRSSRLRRAPIAVLFGSPLSPDEGENTHRFSDRIEAAVATLSREVHSDWWQARRSVSAVAPVEGADDGAPRARRPQRGAGPGRSTSLRRGDAASDWPN